MEVMVGKIIGVCTLLNREIPYLSLRCVAHKLELTFQDDAKDVVLFKEAKELLQGLWKYYHYSPKAARKLKELAQSMGERAHRTVKANGARWIPHLEVQARDSSREMQGRAQNCL
mgnify:FL=1